MGVAQSVRTGGYIVIKSRLCFTIGLYEVLGKIIKLCARVLNAPLNFIEIQSHDSSNHRISCRNSEPLVRTVSCNFRRDTRRTVEFHVSKFTLKLNVPWDFTRDTRRTVKFHISKFTLKLNVLWNFTRDTRRTVKFYRSKFTLKLNVLWNFTHDTCRLVEFYLGESRVAFRIVQFRLHEGSYRVKCVSRSTRLVCGTSVFSANLEE